MEPPIPEWITKEFFEECLRREEGNSNIVAENLRVSPAVPPGNNYGSFIIRVELEWRTKESDPDVQSSKFIVKAELTEEGPMKEMTTEFADNEPSFYYKFIPAAKQFAPINFAATSYFSPKSNVTILEDLKERGFAMADRTKLLDFDHCRLYMIAAAEFHSVSVPVFKKHPEILEPIKREIMFSNDSKTRGPFQKMIKGGLKWFVEGLEKLEKLKFAKTVKDVAPHLWDILVDAHRPSQVINTIKQGDPWVTNMMFKYDEAGKACDVKIIDFQGTGYGSPVGDLMLFIWASATFDVRRNNLDELYRIYVESFNENLKQFNCSERLSYEQMLAEVKKFSAMALFVSSCFFPCMIHPEPMELGPLFASGGADDSELDKFFRKYYSESYQKNILPQVLETLDVNGVFSSLENYNYKK